MSFPMRFSLLLAAFLPLACATMNDVVAQKDKGTTQEYDVTPDVAWDICHKVFRWEGSDAIEDHRAQNYMLTSSGMNFYSDGAVMGAWVEPINGVKSKVTVVTKRRLSFDLATTMTETTFHRRFAQAVEIVKSGKPVPETAPPPPAAPSTF